MSAALQAQDRHLLPAMAPLVYSAGIVVGGLIGARYPGMRADGFAWGVLASSAMGPFALPLYGCIKSRIRWFPILSFRNRDLMRPLAFISDHDRLFNRCSRRVDRKNQASYLAAGALSYLQYGRTLMKVPIGVFGMAAGVAAYPTLSRLVATGRVAEAYGLVCGAVR